MGCGEDPEQGVGEHPARRPGLVLRLRRAARRPAAARPAGDRRRRGGAGRELRGQGVRRDARRWAGGRRRGCARTRWSCRRGSRRTSRPASGSSRSSTTPRRWSRGSRSTRRSSTSAGLRRLVGDPEAIGAALRGAGARGGRAADLGRHRPHQVPRQGRQRGQQAGRAAPGAAGVARQEFLHPLPVERLWGVGKVTAAQAARRRHPHHRRARPPRGAGADDRGRQGGRPAPVGAGQPARPAAGRGRPAAQLDRVAERARVQPAAQDPRRPRRPARRPRRPGRPPAARRRADRPDVHAAAALRRLHPGDPLVDDPALDGVDRDLAGDRPAAARRRAGR